MIHKLLNLIRNESSVDNLNIILEKNDFADYCSKYLWLQKDKDNLVQELQDKPDSSKQLQEAAAIRASQLLIQDFDNLNELTDEKIKKIIGPIKDMNLTWLFMDSGVLSNQ